METHASHENKLQNELVFGVKSDLNVFLSGFVRFTYLDFYKWRIFFHLNLMGAEAVFKVSWPIAGEHNCTNWHVSFYNMTTKCTFAYTAVQRKHYKFSQNKGLLWQVGLTHIQLQFAFEGQYNSLALHFLH